MVKTAKKPLAILLALLITLSGASFALGAPGENSAIDKEAYKALIDNAYSLKEADYTQGSWEQFVAYRSVAQYIYNDFENANPEIIEASITDLLAATDALAPAALPGGNNVADNNPVAGQDANYIGIVPASPVILGAPAPAGVLVASIAELKAAFANPSVDAIIFGADIVAPAKLDPQLVLNHSIIIYGEGKSLDLQGYSINLESNGALKVFNLNMSNSDKNGFFTAYASPTSKAGAWNAEFINTSFTGAALIGQRTASVSYGRIDSVAFYGSNVLNVGVAAPAYAVVYAKNVTISGALTVKGTNNGIFFKSTDSSGVGTGTNAYGSFIVMPCANVNMSRSLSSATANTYKDNLIEGYENYIFGEYSIFNATAGTNMSESNKCYNQTAIIHSGAAKEFTVKTGAKVNLVSDYSLVNYPATHGSTALSLRKPAGGKLDITVQKNAELNITAYGTNAIARDYAPVLIGSKVGTDSGESYTVIQGTLNVNSKNGNGWYYQYIDYTTKGYDSFVVDGGKVNIIADGKSGRATSGEYAAFEHYGPASFDLGVFNGGEMYVKSNGWRGMSLAGGVLSIIPEKTITVKDAGSKLSIIGGQFAIAAEGKTNFTLNVLKGGYVYTENTQDSNIYTVGKATYNVDGGGSMLKMVRKGEDPEGKDKTSLYGVIFHDAPLVGPLSINVTDGGNMSVENNFGSRAAITTQSGYITGHKISVSGTGSKLSVINNNTGNSAANDTSLYPVGAIAFAANCSGNIEISDSGSFYAESYSPDSPTIALGSYGTSNYTGALILDHPYEVDIKNNAATTNPRAIALRGRNYDPKTSKDTAVTFIVKDIYSMSVWNVGFGIDWYDENIVDNWEFVSVIAANSTPSTIEKGIVNGTMAFMLSQYGRIYVKGIDET